MDLIVLPAGERPPVDTRIRSKSERVQGIISMRGSETHRARAVKPRSDGLTQRQAKARREAP
jgi:hypothetical protein